MLTYYVYDALYACRNVQLALFWGGTFVRLPYLALMVWERV